MSRAKKTQEGKLPKKMTAEERLMKEIRASGAKKETGKLPEGCRLKDADGACAILAKQIFPEAKGGRGTLAVFRDGFIYRFHAAGQEQKKAKDAVLDKGERKFVRALIRPYAGKVAGIQKVAGNARECLTVIYKDRRVAPTVVCPFDKGTMYRGMKEGKAYTPEELGLGIPDGKEGGQDVGA